MRGWGPAAGTARPGTYRNAPHDRATCAGMVRQGHPGHRPGCPSGRSCGGTPLVIKDPRRVANHSGEAALDTEVESSTAAMD